MPEAKNERLRAARLRTLSPSGSGRPMSRQELADQGNAVLPPITRLASESDRAITVGTAVIGHGRQLTSRCVNDRIRNLARDIPADTSHSGLADFRRQVSRIELAAA